MKTTMGIRQSHEIQGGIHVLHMDDGTWEVSWNDSNGVYRRWKIDSPGDLEEAIVQARDCMHQAVAGLLRPRQKYRWKPISLSSANAPLMPIEEALLMPERNRGWSSYQNHRYRQYCRYFAQWIDGQNRLLCQKREPELLYWDDVRRSVMEAYLHHLEGRGYCIETIKKYLAPLRLASKHMVAE